MKQKLIIFLSYLCCFSCTNEPIQEYELDKTELENAQKAYENSTVQHQKVQSKSISMIITDLNEIKNINENQEEL